MSDLFDAANAGDLERVQELVKQGAEIDYIGYNDRTPLYEAARNGHLKVVRYLVEQGADLEMFNIVECCPLLVAAHRGHLDVVRYFLEVGANMEKADINGDTSLHWAARNNFLDVAKMLMTYGANLNAKNKSSKLPIDLAANEAIRMAIRDEPERRRDQQPRKRCIEEDQLIANALASALQEDESVGELEKKQPADGEGEESKESKVAEEDQESESSSDEDDHWGTKTKQITRNNWAVVMIACSTN